MKQLAAAAILCSTVLADLIAGQQAPAGAPPNPQIQTRESQAAMTPSAALERLREGNRRFFSNTAKSRDWSAKVLATASGQFPFADVLGCMDSHVPIEIVFDQGIGDVFGVRVAGNVINDDELGSLEYAVKVGWNTPSKWASGLAGYKNFKRPFSARGIVPMDLWVVKDASRRSKMGNFWARSSTRDG